MYLRDKICDTPGTLGTGDYGTKIPGPFHGLARAVRSPLFCRNEPDSIGRHEVDPSQVTGERMACQLRSRGPDPLYPLVEGAYRKVQFVLSRCSPTPCRHALQRYCGVFGWSHIRASFSDLQSACSFDTRTGGSVDSETGAVWLRSGVGCRQRCTGRSKEQIRRIAVQ
jgi:hypothetical protein